MGSLRDDIQRAKILAAERAVIDSLPRGLRTHAKQAFPIPPTHHINTATVEGLPVWDEAAVAAVVRAARAAALREAAEVALKAWPAAHTYASENADLYRAQDAVRDRIVDALRARAEGGA